MTYLISWPGCGERGVDDYRYGGSVLKRPGYDDDPELWDSYFYLRVNRAGMEKEWWYHRMGCKQWFIAERDSTTNQVSATYWPGKNS